MILRQGTLTLTWNGAGYVCDMCGGLVGDNATHARWHDALLYHHDPAGVDA
jgi:hypothetical protein